MRLECLRFRVAKPYIRIYEDEYPFGRSGAVIALYKDIDLPGWPDGYFFPQFIHLNRCLWESRKGFAKRVDRVAAELMENEVKGEV